MRTSTMNQGPVSNPTTHSIQRKCACGSKSGSKSCPRCHSDSEELRRKKSTNQDIDEVPPSVYDVLRSPGQSLDSRSQTNFGARFGCDFSNVRVHHNSIASRSAEEVGANAYAVGNHVVFREDQYAPQTIEGGQLLAHELTHVVQQGNRAWDASRPLVMDQATSSAEREAESTSLDVMRQRDVDIQHASGPRLQGSWDWGNAGIGAGVGALVGGGLGLGFGGGIGGLIGLGLGALVGGVIGGLTGSKGSNPCQSLFDAIRKHPVYLALSKQALAIADDIISIALGRANCAYFAAKLKLLFDTPEAPKAVTGQPTPQGSTLEQNRGRVNQAVAAEKARLATPDGKAEVGRQEKVANKAGRQFVPRKGKKGKVFYVDQSDPNDIVVRVKLRLLAAPGVTSAQDVANEVFLEDAIERVAETRGYTMDVEFVNTDGPDVFTYQINFDAWPTSANPVGNARTLAHEIHHLIGLDDRYDYIESHASNEHMEIPTRLYWFRQQMDRPSDPDGSKSLMGSGGKLLDDDVCNVAGLDPQSCIKARTGKH